MSEQSGRLRMHRRGGYRWIAGNSETGRFRNGMRQVRAYQEPAGDWVFHDEDGWKWKLSDGEFRRRWEPVDEAARRAWRGDEPVIGRSRPVRIRAPRPESAGAA